VTKKLPAEDYCRYLFKRRSRGIKIGERQAGVRRQMTKGRPLKPKFKVNNNVEFLFRNPFHSRHTGFDRHPRPGCPFPTLPIHRIRASRVVNIHRSMLCFLSQHGSDLQRRRDALQGGMTSPGVQAKATVDLYQDGRLPPPFSWFV
jgi:hypothetical protein